MVCLLFIVALIVCGGFVFGPCFDVQYLVSFLVLQSSRWGRERVGCFLNFVLNVM